MDVTADIAHQQGHDEAAEGFLLDERTRQIMVGVIIAMVTIQVFGAISPLIQMSLFGLLAVSQWRPIMHRLTRFWPVLLFPIIAILSTFWSEAPGVSLRYSVQLMITVVGALIVACSLSPRKMMAPIFIGSAVVAILSIASGRQGASAEGPVLIGLTGAKNQIAYLAQLLLALCSIMVFDTERHRLVRLSVLLIGPVSFMLLIGAHSATGILTAIGATGLIFGLMVLRALPVAARIGAILAAIILVTPFAVLKDDIVDAAQLVSQKVFKKDAGLTGRTYLWRQADRLIKQKPVVGHGYKAVWLGKSIESQGLLRWAGVPDPRGFNFHNTFREISVDTGLLGASLFVLAMLLSFWRLVVAFLRDGDYGTAFYLAMFVTIAVRSFTEVIIGPFQVNALLIYLFAAHAAASHKQAHAS